MVDINEYTREASCEYKGELYSVRDNGAVYRHTREGFKPRKLDNIWTFGTKNNSNGYMMINSHRVHIIVAKAFIPGNEDGKMVVDHIDTNRCNNRVENLRWLTRLENVLLNEATLKRVTYLCGGDINKFLENPSCLRDLSGENQDIMWMRTVTSEEAKLAWEHISAWAKRPNSTFQLMKQRTGTKDFEEWLMLHGANTDVTATQVTDRDSGTFKDYSSFDFGGAQSINDVIDQKRKLDPFNEILTSQYDELLKMQELSESLTPDVLQIGLRDKLLFPLCPSDSSEGLHSYALMLQPGKVFACLENGKQYLIKTVGWTFDMNAIQVQLELDAPNEEKRFDFYDKSCIHISMSNGHYLHSKKSFDSILRFCDSPYVVQCGATTQCYFPLCPKDGKITIEEYAEKLQIGALFETNQYSPGYVIDREIATSKEGKPYIYVGTRLPDSAVKQLADMTIFIENGLVIHQLGSTYFDENSLKREFCRLRGQEWEGEVFDDYC